MQYNFVLTETNQLKLSVMQFQTFKPLDLKKKSAAAKSKFFLKNNNLCPPFSQRVKYDLDPPICSTECFRVDCFTNFFLICYNSHTAANSILCIWFLNDLWHAMIYKQYNNNFYSSNVNLKTISLHVPTTIIQVSL